MDVLPLSRAIVVELRRLEDIPDLEHMWIDLQTRSQGSFFLSWVWIGPWLAQLPPGAHPHLLIARRGERVVGLAILCRRWSWGRGLRPGPRWHLHESGDAGLDRVTIEYNGLLLDREAAQETAVACRIWLLRHMGRSGDLVLSGLPADEAAQLGDLAAASGLLVQVRREDAARRVDLHRVARGGGLRAGLGKNTRAALSRAIRLYTQRGELRLTSATSPAEALRFLEEMARLHEASWVARGRTGAFSNPVFAEVHRRLIRDGFATGTIRLSQITAGDWVLGYLYNFVWRGEVLNYQSGFAYEDDNRLKPGLISHVLAIEDAVQRGEHAYDFLAGQAGHKDKLANDQQPLLWLTIGPDTIGRRVEGTLRQVRGRLRLATAPLARSRS